MSVFDIFRKKKSTEERSFYPYISQIFGSSVFAPEFNPTVDTCISLISGTISTLPLSLYVHTKNGLREAWGHDIAKLLRDPAIEESYTLFWRTAIRHMLIKGNCFLFIHRYEGVPVSLEIIDPMTIRVDRFPDGRRQYIITGERGGVFTDRDVCMISYPDESYNGLLSMSPCDVHRNLIKTNDLIREYIAIYFQKGAGSRFLVTLDKDTYQPGAAKTEKLVQEFAQYFNKFVRGRENLSSAIVTPPGSTISTIALDSNDHSQVEKLLNQSNAEIARIMNIPPEVLWSEQSKYNSLSQKMTDFYTQCIHPLARHITEILEKSLLRPEERGRFVIKYDYTSLLESDIKEKTELLVKKFHAGILTLNEVREQLDLSNVENDVEGNTRFLPSNLLPLTEENIKAILAKSKLALQESEAGVKDKSATAVENNFTDHNGTMQDKLM